MSASIETIIAELHAAYGRTIAALTEQVAVARAENTMLRMERVDPPEVVEVDG